MVRGLTGKEESAFHYFHHLLSTHADDLAEGEDELSDAPKKLAIKYNDLSPGTTKDCSKWEEYFVKGLKKFVRDMPSEITDLDMAIAALNREEVAAEARSRGVRIQILPEPAPAGNADTPEALAPHQKSNENANGKRPAEAEGMSSTATDAEVQDRPAKRVKHDEAENAMTSSGFTLETEGSLMFRISDDVRTSTINLNGRGPAIVTVNIQKKDITGSASANISNNNKEANTEGAAQV